MAKFGNKQMRRYAMGVKSGIHTASVIGKKTGDVAVGLSPLVGLAFGPEVGVPLGVGGMALREGANAIEKVSR